MNGEGRRGLTHQPVDIRWASRIKAADFVLAGRVCPNLTLFKAAIFEQAGAQFWVLIEPGEGLILHGLGRFRHLVIVRK